MQEEAKKKFAMIGYYHRTEGGVYAVGNEGITRADAITTAAEEGLELFQLFPLEGKHTGQHQFYYRKQDGEYKQGQSRHFAARLSGYVGKLIERDEADNS